MSRSRQPKGAPASTGGQFAAETRGGPTAPEYGAILPGCDIEFGSPTVELGEVLVPVRPDHNGFVPDFADHDVERAAYLMQHDQVTITARGDTVDVHLGSAEPGSQPVSFPVAARSHDTGPHIMAHLCQLADEADDIDDIGDGEDPDASPFGTWVDERHKLAREVRDGMQRLLTPAKYRQYLYGAASGSEIRQHHFIPIDDEDET